MKTVLAALLQPWGGLFRTPSDWLSRVFSKTIVTLNIEGSSIRVLTAKGRRVRSWGSVPLTPGLAKDGLIVAPAQVGSIIETLLAEKRLSRKRVIASLSAMRSVPRLLSLPRIAPGLMQEAIRHESEREMPVPLHELYLCWQDMGGNGSESRFFVVGVPRTLLDAEVQALSHAGIKSHVLDLKPITLARAVHRKEAVIVNLEADTSDIVLVVEGVPVIMRTLITGGQGVTQEDKVRQTTAEVSRTVEFYNSSHPENPISPATPVVVTGELAEDGSILNLLGGAISGPVETLEPAIKLPAELPVAEYAVNIGLALRSTGRNGSKRGTGFAALDIAITSDTYQARRPLWRTLAHTSLAVFVVALLFPAYLMTRGGEAEVARVVSMAFPAYHPAALDKLGGAAEVSRLELELAALTRWQADIRQTLDLTNSMTTEASQLKKEARTVLGSRGSFSDRLAVVFGTIPPGVILTSIPMTDDATSLNGTANTPFSAINYAAYIQETESFAAVHIASLAVDHGSQGTSITTFSIIAK